MFFSTYLVPDVEMLCAVDAGGLIRAQTKNSEEPQRAPRENTAPNAALKANRWIKLKPDKSLNTTLLFKRECNESIA
ncbi:hypothetical protein [Gimesia sp.]|uniref:hypothetical protein n=1 Tax=Gimesia sp. TaxID=2024833 RepID=UPI003A90BA1A